MLGDILKFGSFRIFYDTLDIACFASKLDMFNIYFFGIAAFLAIILVSYIS